MKNSSLLLFIIALCFSIDIAWAEPQIKIQALFKNKVMALINGKQRLLVAGKTNRDGVLLVKSNSEEAEIKVNGKVKTYRLGNTISTRYKKRENAEVLLWADAQDMFSSNGKINGRPVHFLVDTGATFVAMNENDAKRLGLNYKSGNRGYAQTASGMVNTWLVTLDSVELGQIKVNYVEAMVIQGTASKQILLGMSFLSKVHMTRSGKTMKLVKKY